MEFHKNDLIFSAYVMGASVLVGAILISASVLYVGGGFSGGTTAKAQNTVDQNGVVKIPERSNMPTIGRSNAKVTIVEFSDFQCPYCKKFFDESYATIKEKYIDTGKAKLVFRNFPLPFHANAQKAAEASECANLQGKFEEYHDLLFKNSQSDGTGLAIADLKKYADQLGLNKGIFGVNSNQFNDCLDKGKMADIVKKDLADGTSSGVEGTPTIFVNGKKLVGAQPLATFEQAIDEALK